MSERASLELTHVLYEAESHTSLALALVTLSPILLMPAYASLAVVTREALILEMWAGQFACEAANYLLKHIIKEERPIGHIGNGYGFPSSHSQYMGYFATFLICHLHFRHRFEPCGIPLLDLLWRFAVYSILIVWAGSVCYSRYFLTYHTIPQIAWGTSIGVLLGFSNYILSEFIPRKYPNSYLNRWKRSLLSSRLATWLRIRDGWAVWDDGGFAAEWHSWRSRWDVQNTRVRISSNSVRKAQ